MQPKNKADVIVLDSSDEDDSSSDIVILHDTRPTTGVGSNQQSGYESDDDSDDCSPPDQSEDSELSDEEATRKFLNIPSLPPRPHSHMMASESSSEQLKLRVSLNHSRLKLINSLPVIQNLNNDVREAACQSGIAPTIGMAFFSDCDAEIASSAEACNDILYESETETCAVALSKTLGKKASSLLLIHPDEPSLQDTAEEASAGLETASIPDMVVDNPVSIPDVALPNVENPASPGGGFDVSLLSNVSLDLDFSYEPTAADVILLARLIAERAQGSLDFFDQGSDEALRQGTVDENNERLGTRDSVNQGSFDMSIPRFEAEDLEIQRSVNVASNVDNQRLKAVDSVNQGPLDMDNPISQDPDNLGSAVNRMSPDAVESVDLACGLSEDLVESQTKDLAYELSVGNATGESSVEKLHERSQNVFDAVSPVEDIAENESLKPLDLSTEQSLVVTNTNERSNSNTNTNGFAVDLFVAYNSSVDDNKSDHISETESRQTSVCVRLPAFLSSNIGALLKANDCAHFSLSSTSGEINNNTEQGFVLPSTKDKSSSVENRVSVIPDCEKIPRSDIACELPLRKMTASSVDDVAEIQFIKTEAQSSEFDALEVKFSVGSVDRPVEISHERLWFKRRLSETEDEEWDSSIDVKRVRLIEGNLTASETNVPLPGNGTDDVITREDALPEIREHLGLLVESVENSPEISKSGDRNLRIVETIEENCFRCGGVFDRLALTSCGSTHGICGGCLSEQVKSLLKSTTQSLFGCQFEGCGNFYCLPQLKLVLPSLVFDILSEKLEHEYKASASLMLQRANNCMEEEEEEGDGRVEERVEEEEAGMNPGDEVGGEGTDEGGDFFGSSEVDFPIYDALGSEDYRLVEVAPGSAHFRLVSDQFHATMSRKQTDIIKLERVHNTALHEFFVVKRKQLEAELRQLSGSGAFPGGVSPPLQRTLFHGVKRQFVDVVCRSNFDWRTCGVSHGIMYGKGTYFARDASYAHLYTDKPPDKKHPRGTPIVKPSGILSDSTNRASVGHGAITNRKRNFVWGSAENSTETVDADHIRLMFVASVLVGNYVEGRLNYKKPPPLDPCDPYGRTYHACVNYADDPSLFVLFDSTQYYPEYLVQYVCRANLEAESRG